MKLPVLRVLFDVLVNRVAVLQGAPNQRVGEQARLGLLGGGRRQLDRLAPGGRTFIPGDGGCALRVPKFIERPDPGFPAGLNRAETKIARHVRALHGVCP